MLVAGGNCSLIGLKPVQEESYTTDVSMIRIKAYLDGVVEKVMKKMDDGDGDDDVSHSLLLLLLLNHQYVEKHQKVQKLQMRRIHYRCDFLQV